MLRRLLCFVGLHRYETLEDHGRSVVRGCVHCDRVWCLDTFRGSLLWWGVRTDRCTPDMSEAS